MSRRRIGSWVAIAVLAVAAAVWLLRDAPPPAAAPPPLPVAEPALRGEAAPLTSGPSARATKPAAADPGAGRAAVDVDRSRSDLPQGVRGRVVDPHGAPLAAATVHLLAYTPTTFLRMLQRARDGLPTPPLATATTAADGRFALGLADPDVPDQTLEVRVLAAGLVDGQWPGVTAAAGQWVDLGDLRLVAGGALLGTVRGDRRTPLGNARVRLHAAVQTTAPPGREHGLFALTDRLGNYRLDGVGPGPWFVTAAAPGHGSATESNVRVPAASEVRCDFELPPGLSIEGWVADARTGAAIPGASVRAVAPSSPGMRPSAVATTADDGRFALIGLAPGDYLVLAAAADWVSSDQLLVAAGDTEVAIGLQPRAEVRLRVFGDNGRLVRRYRASPKEHLAGGVLGNCTAPPVQVDNPEGGVAVLRGFDPGLYAVVVHADGYAPGITEPFTVPTEPAQVVELRLDRGGGLGGVVLGHDRQPLAGARVETLPDGWVELGVVSAATNPRQRRSATTTDADGRFALTLLNPEVYQLRVSHPLHSTAERRGIIVVGGEVTRLPDIVLERGVELAGVVRVDGRPRGQIRVTAVRQGPAAADRAMPRLHAAVSADDGRWRMPERLPPGDYVIEAQDQTARDPGLRLLQSVGTRQTVHLDAGQLQRTLDLQLPSGND